MPHPQGVTEELGGYILMDGLSLQIVMCQLMLEVDIYYWDREGVGQAECQGRGHSH